MKKSKNQVDYSKGMKATHCGNCKYFIEPHGCKLVKGHIDPDMWCNKWAGRDKNDRRQG